MRKIGFGKEDDTAEREDWSGPTATPHKGARRILFPVFVLLIMSGIGIALILQGLKQGKGFLVAFAMVWTVVTISNGLRLIIRRLFGKTPKAVQHDNWTLDDQDRS